MEYKTEIGVVRNGTEEDQWLVDESKTDKWMGDVTECIQGIHELYIFVVDGKAVGYVLPRREADGCWRTGCVYLTPSARPSTAIKRMMATFFKLKKEFNYGLDLRKESAA